LKEHTDAIIDRQQQLWRSSSSRPRQQHHRPEWTPGDSMILSDQKDIYDYCIPRSRLFFISADIVCHLLSPLSMDTKFHLSSQKVDQTTNG
jgi:hypothetical protein